MEKRILIVEDHPIVRQGFVQLIVQEPDLTVVGEAEDAPGALQLLKEHETDMALVDLSLKNSNGLELIKDMQILFPGIAVLVVSLHDETLYAERVLRAGAKGFIMKTEATDNMMEAIRTVLSGKVYLSEQMRSRIVEKMSGGVKDKEFEAIESLSDRELEVFELIGKGAKTKVIADTLHLSVKTVETYKAHIKSKLGLSDSTELIQQAVEWSLKRQYYQ